MERKGFVEAAKVVEHRRSDIVSVVRFNREWVRPGSFGGTFANAGHRFWRAERLWQADASVRKAGDSNRNGDMESKQDELVNLPWVFLMIPRR